ncbi:hypothetical protein AX16_005673 [Volvariella volvacea WC 439]|nr:hypothetical protein AX16_005673 [Volvariella volvacea WC 439]
MQSPREKQSDSTIGVKNNNDPNFDPERAQGKAAALGSAQRGSSDDSKGFNTSDKFWGIYVEEAEKVDRDLVEEWTETADSILIFSGLFSAVVTSFIIESYKNLQPDPEDRLADIMITISAQLAASSDGSGNVPAYSPIDHDHFEPRSINVWMNGLWLSSLTFSLITAVFATLLREWARAYRQSIAHHQIPYKRGTIRAYLFAGLEKWKMAEVIDLVPALIHITLILFLAGLTLFLWDLNESLAIMVLVITGGSSVAYGLFSIGTLAFYDFPYHTPLSQWMLRVVSYILSLFSAKWSLMSKVSNLRQSAALKDSRALQQAFLFVMATANEDREIEKLADSLPGLLDNQNPNSAIQDQVTQQELSRKFLVRQAPALSRMLDEIPEQNLTDVEKAEKTTVFLHSISSALCHTRIDRMLGLEGLNEAWFSRSLLYFLHPTTEVARCAMTIYAHLCTAETIPRPSVSLTPDQLLTSKALEQLRGYSLPSLPPWVPSNTPSISWDMVVGCFVRTDQDPAGFIRKAWPDVYKTLASINSKQNNRVRASSPTPPASAITSPNSPIGGGPPPVGSMPAEDRIPLAFTEAAAHLLKRHGEASDLHSELSDDIHKLVRACFVFKYRHEVHDALERALQSHREVCPEGERLYNDFKEIKLTFLDIGSIPQATRRDSARVVSPQ